MNTLIYTIAAVLCGAFSLRTWLGDRRDPVRRAFMVLGVLVGLCYAGFAAYLVPGMAEFRYLYAVAGAFVPAALMWLMDRLFGDPHAPMSQPTARLWAVTPVIAVATTVADVGFFNGSPSAPTRIVLAAFVLFGFGVATRRLWQMHARAEDRILRARLRYLVALLGTSVAFTALEQLLRALTPVHSTPDMSTFSASLILQGAFPPVGAVIGTLLIWFLQQTVQLSRLLDLHEFFARVSTLCAAALVLVGVDGLTLLWSGGLREYPLHAAFQIFLASVFFLAVYEPLRARIEAWTGELFNRQGRRLELTLAEVDQGMAKVFSLDGLGNELLGRLQSSGRAPLVSLYLWEHDRGAFRLTLHRGQPDRPLVRAIGQGPFSEGLRELQATYARVDLRRAVRRKGPGFEHAQRLLRTLDAMESDLCVPMHDGELVVGWLNLRCESWSDGFSREEVRRLNDTMSRAAILLSNIHSFDQAKEQHRLAALGTMSAGLAHEIRNPLAGIKGAAQYLQTTGPDDDLQETADFLEVIVDEADRLNSVVTQFLEYARPYSLRRTASNIPHLLDRVADLVRAQGLPTGVSLEVVVDPNCETAWIDPDKVRQVLLNLVHNALHAFQADRGRVQITARKGQLAGPGGATLEALELVVEDDGPGITPDVLEKLFIPFFTTRDQGTGLGLAISRRLVEAHGGEVAVRSPPGRGATFTLRIPSEMPPQLSDQATDGSAHG